MGGIFCSGFDPRVLDLGIDKISKDFPDPKDHSKPVESLLKLKAMGLNASDFKNTEAAVYGGSNPLLDLSGTRISVFPDLVLRGHTEDAK